MPDLRLSAEMAKQRNLVFWVTYTIDGELSALMGSTGSIQHHQITAQLPSANSNALDVLVLSLHVRLAQPMATISFSKARPVPILFQAKTSFEGIGKTDTSNSAT
jgi:hypothetical protein